MPKRSRRVAPALIAAATVASLVLPLSAAKATSTFSLSRTFDGQNRYDTARKISTGSGFSNVANVVLATGQNFPDALAGNYLAAAYASPILLTARDSLPIETVTALSNVGAKTVTLLGGTDAISAAVENDLRGRNYSVDRVQGPTRYDTALAVTRKASAASSVGMISGKRTAFLATGENFADALAAGPVAYAKHLPIILTAGASLSPQAQQAITELKVEQVVILGGTAAVSGNVQTQVGALPGVTVARLQGVDRTETATAIAEWAIANAGFSTTHVNLARGNDFADALAGGPHGGRESAPVLLANSPTSLDGVSNANAKFLTAHADTLENGNIFGGVAAISQAVADAAEAAGGAAPPEAGAGSSTPTVLRVNTTEGYFVSTDNRTYFYDSGDKYQFNGTTLTAGMSQFESLLNPDDVVTVIYDPNASGVSTFNLTKDVVHAPIKPGVAAVTHDAKGVRNDVAISIVLPTNNSPGTTYTINRYPVIPDCGGAPSTQAQVVTATVTASGTVYDDNPAGYQDGLPDQLQPQGCFVYEVVAKSPAPSTVTAKSPQSDQIHVPGPSDTTPPTIESLTLTDGGTVGAVDKGDVHTFRFSEPMADSAGASGATYRLVDGDGTQVDVICGTNADCKLDNNQAYFDPASQQPPKQVGILTVTLTATPAVVSGSGSMTYTASILSMNGSFKDQAGNPVKLAGSDVVLP